ncbi:hypothetical protein HCN44_001184 [Aphidius gifuensis]|uniref:Structural maintenance of chromosomes protein n=1 Tax=Aphidius gifuensis TaxID=684658 RepID=A0A834XM96_APHGI|nr:structural maintenance of chromosomes protein 3-like [Aphidius gifuensis]KAF7988611.1 hypothetical protein HCN44_001184 [Aphidius gifuensis]
MHIKKVIIQGFKSFREQIDVEDFHPGHNVVIGRNGSGKSNFFHAIQFVLSDEFTNLKPEHRQILIHEGSGSKLIYGFVEIIFDNSDGRLPMDNKEVTLRRIIGTKKDQYILNNKVATRTDVTNLLESAGFSHSNPYYIVKQGEINQLAIAPDEHRLNLLLEVAGTIVYDERRRESNEILEQTKASIKKITEFIITIDERLLKLDEEKEELKQYQLLDKQRRYIEFTIYDRELKEYKNKLDELLALRENNKGQYVKLGKDLNEAQQKKYEINQRIKELKKQLQSAKDERIILTTDQQNLLKDKTKLTLIIEDLMDDVKDDTDDKLKLQQELEQLNITIDNNEQQLAIIIHEYNQLKYQEEECVKLLESKEQKRKELYAKEGRCSQFSSKDERDNWIKEQLKQLTKHIKEKLDYEKKLNELLNNDIKKQNELEKSILIKTKEMEEQKELFNDDVNKKYHELIIKKNNNQGIIKDYYRQENKLELHLSSLKEDLSHAEGVLRSMIGKAIINGRDSVKKVLEKFNQQADMSNEIDNYCGPLIDNFKCDKEIYTAVEVTAGNRLFHHIIKTDTFGTKILKEMNQQKLPGEVTFMPLNRLYVKPILYPNDPDAIPMISKLNYDEKYDRAMRYIFGRTLICRSLELATKLARTTGLDCVTLEGDQVSSKGSLTGGHFNTQKSRLDLHTSSSILVNEINKTEQQLSCVRNDIKKFNDELNVIMNDIQKHDIKKSKAKGIYELLNTEIRNMKDDLMTIISTRESYKNRLIQNSSNLENLNETKKGFESELYQELITQLSTQDQHQVDNLNDEIRSLTITNKNIFTKRMQFEAEKNKFDNLLINNLYRRKDELIESLKVISIEDRNYRLNITKTSLSDIDNKLLKINNDLSILNNKITITNEKLNIEISNIDKFKNQEKDIQQIIDSDAKQLNKFTCQQNTLENNISECTKKITDLGALPSSGVYENLINLSTKQLLKEIDNINNQLKDYKHVNKKALDQYLSFTDQRQMFMKRKEELDRADIKIKELMNVLEMRKFEAMQFTFKQVSKYFSDVFKKLVPIGHAELIIKKHYKHDDDYDDDDYDNESNKLAGIGIRVSFNGKDNEMREINHLSGGQKSLVALALIFAIQKCDPAPFYLFDEIDQALDPEHRKTVANMIHELSSDAQFITTTFRPEMLEHADKFYGVIYRNKVSHVICVTREEADNFIEDDTTQD